MDLNTFIRDIPDWPKPGIVFKDITPLLADPAALAMAVEQMANPYRGRKIDVVVGTESRGFIFGTAIAQALSAGFIPVRKPGKLPAPTHRKDYELEYGTDALEIHQDAIKPGQRAIIIDDVLATGGTMKASLELVDMLGAEICGVSVLIELAFLEGRAKLAPFDRVNAVLTF
jgi:adenine phosphoribosyltransferase